MPPRLLLVEDDPAVRRSLAETLEAEGVDVHVACSAEEALGRLAEVAPEVVLTDVRMPGMDGLSLLRLLRERVPDVDVVVMTAFEEMPTIVQAMRDGAFEFIVKPPRLADLRSILARLLEDRRMREEGRRLRGPEVDAHHLDAIVGRHPRIVEVYKLVGQLAASRVNALIRGETGSGKGMVARAIHYNSPDAGQPFIAVNCTAIPETLLESELFGHVRGAFTGAVSDRRGRFALAQRGTIFLDEVGDTSPEFQAKLLKVIEDRQFYPVGSERAERTEARVIAATHRDLEVMVEQGQFRQDLYYRLRVVEITMPSLRERPDDIPLLAAHFLRRAALELHRVEIQLGDDALAALMQHSWTGNVRELENCIMRAAVLTTGSIIRREHLGLQEEPCTNPARGFPTLEALEAEHVARALAVTDGNRTRAAEILGISKPRLYRYIEKYALQ
jgi:two-component system, NtrC family, response regulator AtoC